MPEKLRDAPLVAALKAAQTAIEIAPDSSKFADEVVSLNAALSAALNIFEGGGGTGGDIRER